MAARGLIDASGLIAILDRDDRWHEACRHAFERATLPLMTSLATLTEAFHLLKRARVDEEITWTFLRSGSIVLGTITDEDLPNLHALMYRYSDRPMDFADATLVHLAQRESLSKILTVDHDDFETYRIGGRQRFQIVPGRRL